MYSFSGGGGGCLDSSNMVFICVLAHSAGTHLTVRHVDCQTVACATYHLEFVALLARCCFWISVVVKIGSCCSRTFIFIYEPFGTCFRRV